MAANPCFALDDNIRRRIRALRSSVCGERPAFLDDASLNPECERLRQRLGIAESLEA